MGTTFSFRTREDNNLVKYTADGFSITGKYEKENRLINAALNFSSNTGKIYKINNKKTTRSNIDRLRVVLFTPDDLYLIKGSPSHRRDFVDFILRQISDEYVYNLQNYAKILKKRNLLLRDNGARSKTFKIINELFIDSAVKIILARINFVNILDETARQVYSELTNERYKIKIRYAISFPLNNDKINLDILTKALQKQLINKNEREVIRKSTLMGPHLDDIHVYQDDKMARIFASQGQQRNIAISLKLAELYTFRKIKGFFPVFLLDEVLAELDDEKKQLLVKHLATADFQSFLTSVNFGNINYYSAKFSLVINGHLE